MREGVFEEEDEILLVMFDGVTSCSYHRHVNLKPHQELFGADLSTCPGAGTRLGPIIGPSGEFQYAFQKTGRGK